MKKHLLTFLFLFSFMRFTDMTEFENKWNSLSQIQRSTAKVFVVNEFKRNWASRNYYNYDYSGETAFYLLFVK